MSAFRQAAILLTETGNIINGSGDLAILPGGEGLLAGNLAGKSEAVIVPDSQGIVRGIFTGRGEALAQAGGEGSPALEIAGKGEAVISTGSEGKLARLLPPASGPGFTVKVQPRIRGGCALTFKGEPNKVVLWSLVGKGPDGFECEPAGKLARAWTETDGLGHCINYYTASREAADAGKTDRIMVQYAEHA